MNSRELATVLAALHYWRREGLMSAGHEQDIASNGDTIQPLNEEEIHSLCDRLKIEPEANKLLRSIVNDVQGMRAGECDEEDPTWFVRFPEGYYNSDADHYGVCWPNLAILVDEASKLLDGQPVSELYLLQIHGDVEPQVLGPFDSYEMRLAAAREIRAEQPDCPDGLYMVNGFATVEAFSGGEMEIEEEQPS
jgi:hypothetical protein